ncbi:sulfite exporter TauE/SafE family protein, partial [Ruminococcus sp. RTP21484sp1_RTP21281st1_A2_RTP21281_210402]
MVLVYLVVCFFVFLAGFVDSIAGGGGLISLPAYMIAGLPVHTAIATNKMSSSMGTFVASFHYMKKGFMKWKICIPAVFGAIAGSWIGSHLALLISEKALKIAMLVVLPVIL